MAAKSLQVAHGKRFCGRPKRQGGDPCTRPAGWGTQHAGTGPCKFHGGNTPIKHGRYSQIKREELRALIERHEADPDPLNLLPELAIVRGLLEDFINRYDQWRDALVDWHQTFRQSGRPIPGDLAGALDRVLDEYEALLGDRDGATVAQQQDLGEARTFVKIMQAPAADASKPVQVLDLSDAVRHAEAVSRIVKRIEDIRSQNAISRPELLRIMQEMGRVVARYVADEETREKIQDGWLSIRAG